MDHERLQRFRERAVKIASLANQLESVEGANSWGQVADAVLIERIFLAGRYVVAKQIEDELAHLMPEDDLDQVSDMPIASSKFDEANPGGNAK